MIVQARLHRAYMLAEAQHDAELFGLDPEESGQAPDHQGHQQDDRDAHAAEIPARQQLLKPVLAAAQKIFKIGRPRPRRLRAGAPWPLRTGAPRASALILPRHRQSPSRARGKDARPSQYLIGLIGDRPGPYNAACWLAGAMLAPAFVDVNVAERS